MENDRGVIFVPSAEGQRAPYAAKDEDEVNALVEKYIAEAKALIKRLEKDDRKPL